MNALRISYVQFSHIDCDLYCSYKNFAFLRMQKIQKYFFPWVTKPELSMKVDLHFNLNHLRS